jgi:hypothetical protein
LEDAGIEGSIILKCIFKQWDVGVWTQWIRFRKRPGFFNAVMNLQVP